MVSKKVHVCNTTLPLLLLTGIHKLLHFEHTGIYRNYSRHLRINDVDNSHIITLIFLFYFGYRIAGNLHVLTQTGDVGSDMCLLLLIHRHEYYSLHTMRK